MHTKRIIAIVASPLVAGALAFSPALMTQAVADTAQAPTVSAPSSLKVKSPQEQGKTDGKKAGKKDGKNCEHGKSYNPKAKQAQFTKKDYTKYKGAYSTAYEKAYDENFDEEACEDDE
ncbi:hypothetical protein [Streptomyces sp. NPDC020377]|uniref:hypothetical protein n=1 Tax=Streptomyces sp. NPDC020377 TaxID=3365070 RepID=UPI0037AB01E3